MTKRDLIKKAIGDIKLSLEIREQYAEEHNWDMYSHMCTVVNAKTEFLFTIGLISYERFRQLNKIANRS